jgi:hypothetical protein
MQQLCRQSARWARRATPAVEAAETATTVKTSLLAQTMRFDVGLGADRRGHRPGQTRSSRRRSCHVTQQLFQVNWFHSTASECA